MSGDEGQARYLGDREKAITLSTGVDTGSYPVVAGLLIRKAVTW